MEYKEFVRKKALEEYEEMRKNSNTYKELSLKIEERYRRDIYIEGNKEFVSGKREVQKEELNKELDTLPIKQRAQ